jgi:hypothetical protein
MEFLAKKGTSIYDNAWNYYQSELTRMPDFDDCLYE